MTLSESDTRPVDGGSAANRLPLAQWNAENWLRLCLVRGRTERFSKIVQITPKLAALLFALNAGNRPASRAKAKKYGRIMARGDWILTSQGLDISRTGRLLNGQHRLTAVSETGVAVPMTVWFGCDDAEFKALDKAGARTSADDLAVMGFDRAGTAAATAKLKMILEGETEIDPGAVTTFANAEMDRAVLQRAATIGRRKIMGQLGQASAVALAHYCIATQSKYGESMLPDTFWEEFGDGTGKFGKAGSLNKLRNTLTTTARAAARVDTDALLHQASILIAAWNAYVTNTKVNLASPGARKLPVVV